MGAHGSVRRGKNTWSDDVKEAFTKYNDKELGLLDKMFRDLAGRSPEDMQTISKETFLQVFKLPGILGDRLFKAFDIKSTSKIDFDEFVSGLGKYVRGSLTDKMDMLFTLFDMDSQGYITRKELQTVLFSLITPAISFLPIQEDEKRGDTQELIIQSDGKGLSYRSQDVVDKINQMVEEAFEECDLDRSGGLDPQQFKRWCSTHPEVTQGLESILIQNTWAQNTDNPMFFESLWDADHVNVTNKNDLDGRREATKSCQQCQFQFHVGTSRDDFKIKVKIDGINFDEMIFCPICTQKLKSSEERTHMPIMKADRNSKGVRLFSGELSEPQSAKLKTFTKRVVVLRGRFLYFFKSEGDQAKGRSQRITFIQGWFVEAFPDDSLPQNLKGRGFRLIPPRGIHQESQILFASNNVKRTEWIRNLQVAAQTVSIEQYYTLNERLGSGSFSEVFKGKKLSSGVTVAVKCIIKKKISAREKEALHIEMAVMKLVKHPNIICLYEIFESIDYIYLVMPLYTTDMYNRLKKKGIYKEDEAKIILWRLLHAVEYLHAVGIVHRDLKPENILMKRDDDDTDFVIADFGLSKFASPHEVMNLPCGTITYVAPEVLRLRGYGKSVDVWSAGVIAFVILRGRLPFESRQKKVIVHKILNEEPMMSTDDPKWMQVSPQGRELVKQLLTKRPDKRPSIKEALKHPWFSQCESMQSVSVFDLRVRALSSMPSSPVTTRRSSLASSFSNMA